MAPGSAAPSFNPQHLQRLLHTHWLGRIVIYEPVVGSTMDVARERIAGGTGAGTIVTTDEQTAGRGRLGRRWLAPPGVNLALSIILYPSPLQLKGLAMLAPLAVAEGVEAETGIRCDVKWPNDVQVAGRKLSGILLESEWSGAQPRFAIVGVGINVNFDTAVEPEIAAIATSILRETGRMWAREAILAAVLNAFERLYAAEPGVVWQRWRSRLVTLGRAVRISVQGHSEDGLAEDVDPEGSLLLRRADGSLLLLPAGEVSLRSSAADQS